MLPCIFFGLIPFTANTGTDTLIAGLSIFLLEKETLFLYLQWQDFFIVHFYSDGLLDLLEGAKFRIHIHKVNLIVKIL